MLLRYSVENFLSFNEKIEFLMTPGKYRSLKDHVIQDKKNFSYLKNTIIYGANASGKSNFIKSINFAKKFITKGKKIEQNIHSYYFKFDSINSSKPSIFDFSFLIDNKQYNFGFKVTQDKVIEEWLNEVTKYSEKRIFHRTTTKKDIAEVNINFESENSKDNQFLQFVARGTRPNKLFLTECKNKNVKNNHINNCYNWFNNVLTIIFPESRFQGLEIAVKSNSNFKKEFINFLKKFDVGISDINYFDIDFESIKKDIPSHVIDLFLSKLQANSVGVLKSGDNSRYLFLKDNKNKINIQKLLIQHKLKNSNDLTTLELQDESDGTQRLFDLIPMFIMLPNKVFLIDEIDRSLHPHICYDIFKTFNKISDSKTQLIATTHNTILLDFSILRRDEIWFIEKNINGESNMYSLEEYKPRYDKDILTGYLKGRFGAIPMISKN